MRLLSTIRSLRQRLGPHHLVLLVALWVLVQLVFLWQYQVVQTQALAQRTNGRKQAHRPQS